MKRPDLRTNGIHSDNPDFTSTSCNCINVALAAASPFTGSSSDAFSGSCYSVVKDSKENSRMFQFLRAPVERGGFLGRMLGPGAVNPYQHLHFSAIPVWL